MTVAVLAKRCSRRGVGLKPAHVLPAVLVCDKSPQLFLLGQFCVFVIPASDVGPRHTSRFAFVSVKYVWYTQRHCGWGQPLCHTIPANTFTSADAPGKWEMLRVPPMLSCIYVIRYLRSSLAALRHRGFFQTRHAAVISGMLAKNLLSVSRNVGFILSSPEAGFLGSSIEEPKNPAALPLESTRLWEVLATFQRKSSTVDC